MTPNIVARRVLSRLAAALSVALILATAGAKAAEPPKFAGLDGNFSPIEPTLPMAAPAFEDRMGQPVTLDAFKGKVVLVNLWATWCPSCVAEMPALDRLQSELGGEDFIVIAVSTDRQGIKVSAPFFRRAGITHLKLYNDTRGGLLPAFNARAMPTTILLDREGRVVGRVEGAAQWDSAEGKALIEHYIKGGAS